MATEMQIFSMTTTIGRVMDWCYHGKPRYMEIVGTSAA